VRYGTDIQDGDHVVVVVGEQVVAQGWVVDRKQSIDDPSLITYTIQSHPQATPESPAVGTWPPVP